jgi:cation:H+ antiporter
MTETLLLFPGFAALLAGAELLVQAAVRLSRRLGIPALIIGLTVVAFGTSLPELAVSLRAGAAGQASISLGNIFGSNIFNVLLILGLSALITPLNVSKKLIQWDVPLMIGASCLILLLGMNGTIGRWEGMTLVLVLAAYTAGQFTAGRRESPVRQGESGRPIPERRITRKFLAVEGASLAGGLALLVLGSRWLVTGAVDLARLAGATELVIGLTVIAAGTSLPELATSILAALHGERDLAVGNVVGSNIFNLLAILGLAASLSPPGLAVPEQALSFDLPVMIAVSLACLPIFFTGHRISRWEGALFLMLYIAYTAVLILASAGHAALPPLGWIMAAFVIPLAAVTLVILALRTLSRKNMR